MVTGAEPSLCVGGRKSQKAAYFCITQSQFRLKFRTIVLYVPTLHRRRWAGCLVHLFIFAHSPPVWHFGRTKSKAVTRNLFPLLPFFFFPFSLPSIFFSLSLRLEAAPLNRSRDLGNAVSSPSEPQTCFWYLEPGERVWWLKSEKVCSIYVEKNLKTEANEANVLFPDCLWNFSYFIFLIFQRPKYPPPVTALLKQAYYAYYFEWPNRLGYINQFD